MMRLVFVAGVLTGILLTTAFRRRLAQTAQPDTPATEDMKWDKRINEMISIYAEEKANSRLGKR